MKFPILFTSVLFSVISAYGQQSVTPVDRGNAVVLKPYFRLGFGGGLVHNGALGFTGTSQQESGKVRYSSSPVSFSSGASVSFAAGCTFNKHLGVDVAATYFPGSQSYSFFENSAFSTSLGAIFFEDKVTTTNIKAPLFIIPSVVVRSGWKKVDPYMRMGISLLLQNSFNVQVGDTIRNNYANSFVRYTDKYEMKPTIGLNAVGGCSFNLSGHFRLWCEVGMLSHNPWLRSRETTAYSENGFNMLNSMAKTDRYTRYGTSTYNEPTSNDYSWGVTQRLPYSNINFSAGITYILH